jgi:beta-galactosidase/beta-glucuronidase
VLDLTFPSRRRARVRLQTDFDWKFYRGDTPGYNPPECPASGFPINMTNMQCFGLQNVPATDAASCEFQCCLDWSCQVWQWCPEGQTCGGTNSAQCWIGAVNQCNPVDGWVSMARNDTSPGPPIPGPQQCPQSPACVDYDDSSWRVLNVPHDYVVEGTFNASADRGHGYLPFSNAWYRKSFNVDASWEGQLIYMDFDGVYRASDWWLNGVYVGHHESGYTPFRWYLHNVSGAPLNYGGENLISVHIDGTSHQEGWFYEGSGIYRHTALTVQPNASIVPWGVYAPSVITGAISSPQGLAGPQTAASAVVNLQTDIAYAGTDSTGWTLTSSVLDASGNVVGSAKSTGTLGAGGWSRVAQTIVLNGSVNLWNLASPYLYTVNSQFSASNGQSDAVNTTIGIRSAIFDANAGFLLNGLPQKIKGFSMHQDLGGCGTAMPDAANLFRLQSLKQLGATGWRTAHNVSVANFLLCLSPLYACRLQLH